MKKNVLGYFLAMTIMLGSGSAALAQGAQAGAPHQTVASAAAPNYRLSGPYNSGNLSIFLIHGDNKLKDQNYLTLQEGLASKKVVVSETGNVNELTIDNRSNAVVFIQSGDIVKGGQQDRAMQSDLIVPPHTKMPLPAFCVEHGRWSQRGKENVSSFASSGYALSGKNLKLAAKKDMDQSKVWAQVAAKQSQLVGALGPPPMPSPSPSSLQLTLESPKVKGASANHVGKLKTIVEGQTDAIGYAFAINGKINSADVYASNTLFKKLWPKLLESTAIEAVSEKADKNFKPATEDAVRRSLADAEKAPLAPQYNRAAQSYSIQSKENAQNIMFDTLDMRNKGISVHKNYIAK